MTAERAASRGMSRVLKAGIAIAVLIALMIVGAIMIDRRGTAFFETGRDIVVSALDPFAAALAAGDAAAMERLYAADFAGTRLGLSTRALTSEIDGTRRFVQKSDKIGRASGRGRV